MDAFAYLSVLLSIVLGLGLTQVLTVAGRLIRHRERVRAHWLPLMWAAMLVVIYVQVWWAMYGLRLVHDWTFMRFCTVLAQAVTLYMMAAVVLPEQVEEGGVDLGDYYDRHHRWFFSFFLATLGISVAKDLLINGHLPDAVNLGFHVVLGAGCVSALVIRRRRYQEWLAVAFAAGLVVYIWLLFSRLA